MRTNKYILLAATLLGLSSCGNKRGDYDASGTFEATEVIVSSEANGKIMQFNIEEGQLLKAGEEVGCIDTLQLYLKKMQLLASGKAIASKSTDINKQIAATKEQIGKAEYERKRTENLPNWMTSFANVTLPVRFAEQYWPNMPKPGNWPRKENLYLKWRMYNIFFYAPISPPINYPN